MGRLKNICVVTGSRAKFGLMTRFIKRLQHHKNFQLQLVVTGMHLSPEFGLTFQNIVDLEIPIAHKVEMLLSSDTPVGTAKSMGVGMMGFADCFEKPRPDLLIVLGDRFEVLSAAQSAMISHTNCPHKWR